MRIDPKIKPELFVSADDTRPHIAHVHLDVEAKRLVATDGHRMIVTPVEDVDGDHSGPVATAALVAARKLAKRLAPEVSANGKHELPDGTTLPRPTDTGDFPPWKQVMPKEATTDVTIGVSARYLASVFAAIGDHCVALTVPAQPLDPITVRYAGELGETTIVIMPMHLG